MQPQPRCSAAAGGGGGWGGVPAFATVPLESFLGRQVMLVVKNLPAHAGDERDAGWIPGSKQNPSHPIGLNHSDSGSGRSPGGENGNPLQYSCLGNPMGRGAWRAAVHGVMKSWTPLKRLSRQPREQPDEMDEDPGHILWSRNVPNKRISKMEKAGTSWVAQWLILHAPKAGTWDSIPGQGTRSHVPPTTKDPAR